MRKVDGERRRFTWPASRERGHPRPHHPGMQPGTAALPPEGNQSRSTLSLLRQLVHFEQRGAGVPVDAGNLRRVVAGSEFEQQGGITTAAG